MGVHGYTGTGKKCYLNEAEGAWWSSIGKTGETSRCGTADNAKASAKPLTDILWYTWLLVPLGQNHGTYHGLTPYPGCKWKWTLNFSWRRLGQPFFCPLMLVQCCTGNRFHLSKVEKQSWCWLVIWAVKNPESTVGEWMAKLNCQDSRSSKFGCFDLVTLFTMFVYVCCFSMLTLPIFIPPSLFTMLHHIRFERLDPHHLFDVGRRSKPSLNCAKWSATQGEFSLRRPHGHHGPFKNSIGEAYQHILISTFYQVLERMEQSKQSTNTSAIIISLFFSTAS